MKFLVVGIKINNFYKNISIAQNQRFLETFLIFISKQTIYLSIPTYIFPYSKSKYFFEFFIHSCRLKIRQNIFTKKMCIVVYTTKTIQKRWSTNYRYFSSITYIYPDFFDRRSPKKIWVYHTASYLTLLFDGIYIFLYYSSEFSLRIFSIT